MKKTTVFDQGTDLSNNKFSNFLNNVIAKTVTSKIIGGENEIPLPQEGSDFIVIEDIIDL